MFSFLRDLRMWPHKRRTPEVDEPLTGSTDPRLVAEAQTAALASHDRVYFAVLNKVLSPLDKAVPRHDPLTGSTDSYLERLSRAFADSDAFVRRCDAASSELEKAVPRPDPTSERRMIFRKGVSAESERVAHDEFGSPLERNR